MRRAHKLALGIEGMALLSAPALACVPGGLNPTYGSLDKMTGWLRKAAQRKMALTPDMVAAEARKLGPAFELRVKASGKIRMTGRRVSLACGCKTYYPGP